MERLALMFAFGGDGAARSSYFHSRFRFRIHRGQSNAAAPLFEQQRVSRVLFSVSGVFCV